MEKKDERTLYPIGSYAHYLGVTPDFLKHYERYHLIHTQTRESGYRYYPFGQTFRLIECLKMRNLSVPLRTMDALLNRSSEDEVMQYMDNRVEEIRRTIRFEQAVVRDQERLARWLRRMRAKDEDWSLLQDAELLFLPHTSGRSFLQDERIYAILSSWTDRLPIVKSCMRFDTEAPSAEDSLCWGLLAGAADCAEHGIAVNDVVERIHMDKALVYSFARASGSREEESARIARILGRLHAIGLAPAGYAYKVMFFSTHIDSGAQHYGCYLFALA